MKLRSVLSQYGDIAGSTEEGRAFCLKALHPADPIVEVRGLPDESAYPTVFMNYQTIVRIPASGVAGAHEAHDARWEGWDKVCALKKGGAGGSVQPALIPPQAAPAPGTWDADILITPDAIHHAAVITTTSTATTSGSVLNAGLTGTLYSEKLNAWLGFMPQRHRLVYMGVSLYQDGPALADQGTLVAYQHAVDPEEISLSHGYESSTNLVFTTIQGLSYDTADLGAYETAQTMPNTYMGPSKEGCYMPLRLTETSQDWVTRRDLSLLANGYVGVGPTYGPASDLFVPNREITSGTPPHQWPFPAILPATVNTGNWYFFGEPVYPMAAANWGNIHVRGMAETSSLNMFIRVGVEIQVAPGSLLAPQQRISPKYDPAAIDAYFRIAREMKDAYPVEYNDLGKLWNVIHSIGKAVLPGISMIPHPIAQGVAAAGRMLLNAIPVKDGSKPHSAPAAAAVQTARQQVAAQGDRRVRIRPKKKKVRLGATAQDTRRPRAKKPINLSELEKELRAIGAK